MLALILILALLAYPAFAEPPVNASDAWVRAGAPGAPVLAGYMTLTNRGDTDAKLTGVVSPQFERVELHESVMEGGIAYMDKLDGIVVPAGGRVVLEPGGKHLMLISPETEIAEGSDIELLLMFEDGWQLALTVPVRAAGGNAHRDHH